MEIGPKELGQLFQIMLKTSCTDEPSNLIAGGAVNAVAETDNTEYYIVFDLPGFVAKQCFIEPILVGLLEDWLRSKGFDPAGVIRTTWIAMRNGAEVRDIDYPW